MKKSSMGFLWILIFMSVVSRVSWAQDSLSGPLSPYEKWAGEATVKKLLQFVRETVVRLLDSSSSENVENRSLFPWIHRPVGVFVTAMDGKKVRVCVGIFTPQQDTLGEELEQQCRRLIVEDPRHAPLSPDELQHLRLVVTLTGDPQPVSDPSQVDIWRNGLLARGNSQEAVLLPGEAKTFAWGLRELRRQLKISPEESLSYYSFPVLVFSEPPHAKMNE